VGKLTTPQPDSSSGAGGMGFKPWADQISQTLLTTRQRCQQLATVATLMYGPRDKSNHSWHLKGY